MASERIDVAADQHLAVTEFTQHDCVAVNSTVSVAQLIQYEIVWLGTHSAFWHDSARVVKRTHRSGFPQEGSSPSTGGDRRGVSVFLWSVARGRRGGRTEGRANPPITRVVATRRGEFRDDPNLDSALCACSDRQRTTMR